MSVLDAGELPDPSSRTARLGEANLGKSADEVKRHTPDIAHKPSVSILYLGVADGTSLDRANALQRLGHSVDHVDLRKLMPASPWVYRITWHIGGHLLGPWILHTLPKALGSTHYDLCFVDSGEWVTPAVINLIRRYADKIVNYNIDDPLGPRDSARFVAYRKSLRFYDLCVVVRADNVQEAKRSGAKDVMRVYMSSDEVTHAPRVVTPENRERWKSDVLFIGTWFPERGPFLVDLIRMDVPVTIRGANWNKAPEWPILKPHWKGGEVRGDDYALAIQCAKVNLGLLSKGNRDLHTTRSSEIPAVGGLLCAQRTTEHLGMYIEGEEALFWKDAEECAAVCRSILIDEDRRQRIAAAGHLRSIRNANVNENIMSAILARLFAQ